MTGCINNLKNMLVCNLRACIEVYARARMYSVTVCMCVSACAHPSESTCHRAHARVSMCARATLSASLIMVGGHLSLTA